MDAHDWSLTPLLVGLVLARVALARWGGSRTPRTAEGSALRIQALGFREYLATAEADRLPFEEKRALLSSYLPYAVAFGLTGHFAALLRELAKDSSWSDYVDGLDWYDFGVGDGDVSLGDALSDLGDATTGIGDVGARGGAESRRHGIRPLRPAVRPPGKPVEGTPRRMEGLVHD